MIFRKIWLLALLCAAALSLGARPAHPRVVVLGFDGADPGLIRKYMAEGDLPHLKKLAQEGVFSDLQVTNPPQTPVSWGTFMTSWNPGRDQVFDFLRRDVKTYKPSFALMAESSRPVFLGKWNKWIISAAALLSLLLLVLLVRVFIRKGKVRVWALIGILLGAAAGGWMFHFVSVYVPERVPKAVNRLKGTPFWKYAAEAGRKCLVFRVADTFPARGFPEGRLVSGLGVPDIRGRVGTPYIFTTDPAITGGDNEFSVEIVPVSPVASYKKVTVPIKGPFNKPFYQYVVDDALEGVDRPELRKQIKERVEEKLKREGVKPTINIPLQVAYDPKAGTCTFTVQGQSDTLKKGEWSNWFQLNFAFNKYLHLQGLSRFYLMEAGPELKLYMSPIHISPVNVDIPISFPRDYAEKLLEKFGYYKTMGWAIDTWTISSGLADEDQFLSDMNHTVNTYDKMMQGLLPKGDYDLYVQVYYFTDRIQHVLWRYMDPKHPMYVASKAPKYQAAIKAAYERMDQIVGQAMREMPKGSVLMVLSDHGFTSFRYGVNYNRWLIDHGYMTLKADTGVLSLQDLFDDNRLLFKNVDWSKTKAYALGLGNIYINVKGREAHGIVEPGKQYREVCEAIQKELPQMVDPATGEHPVYKVYTRDELYSDYNPDLVPDLRVTNIPGYRVSWQTSLGGAPDQLITPNKKAWSGDHCSMDPSFVPGSFFLSVPINEHPRMIDVAPTILKLLHVKVPASMEGHPMVGGGETR